MTIDKNMQGAWRITDIINDQLITKVYYYYTKKEAIQLFKLQYEVYQWITNTNSHYIINWCLILRVGYIKAIQKNK